MVNYKNPAIELMPDPVALDLAIQTMQEKLATGLPWLQKAFGRAMAQTMKNPEQRQEGSNRYRADIIVPLVHNGFSPMPVMVNDNLKSYCFFFPKDPQEFTGWQSFTLSTNAVQPLAIIFWMNLEKIDPAKKYNFSETLRADVVRVLKKCPDFILQESSTGMDKVFAPFTITETFKQYMKAGYAAFRFDGLLHFDYSAVCVEPGPVTPEVPVIPNWTGFTFDEVTGEMTFTGSAPMAGVLTRPDFSNSANFTTGYINGEGRGFSVGPFEGHTITAPYFTPGIVHFRWQRIGNTAGYPELTPWQNAVMTVTRLSRRWLRFFRQDLQGFPSGNWTPAVVCNIGGAPIAPASTLEEVIAAWNSDPVNQAFGTAIAWRQYPNMGNAEYYELQIEPVPEATAYPMQYIMLEGV